MAAAMEGSMPQRMVLVVPFILAALLALALSDGSHGVVRAADECLASPKGTAPAGKHWYYRVDHKTKRHCWYVGALDRKAARRASVPRAPLASAEERPAQLTPAKSAPAPTEPAQSAPALASSVPAPARSAGAVELFRDFSRSWPELPKSPVSPPASTERAPALKGDRLSDARQTTASQDAAQEMAQVAANEQDDMPLVWPVLSAEDEQAPSATAAAAGAGEPSMAFRLLVALIAGLMAMLAAVIIRAMYKIATAEPSGWPVPNVQPQRLVGTAKPQEQRPQEHKPQRHEPREHVPQQDVRPMFSGPVAAARLAERRAAALAQQGATAPVPTGRRMPTSARTPRERDGVAPTSDRSRAARSQTPPIPKWLLRARPV
jgi:hypothetical protein